MNADRFRLVFNATRGLLMAVAETAAGHGRGAWPALWNFCPPDRNEPVRRFDDGRLLPMPAGLPGVRVR